MRIAFVSAELAPWTGEGRRAQIARSLPEALAAAGHDVRLFVPGYRGTAREGRPASGGPRTVEVQVGDQIEVAELRSLKIDGLEILFVHHDAYFDRAGIFDDGEERFVDNLARYSFLVRASLAWLSEADEAVDVVHADGWPAALLPVYRDAGVPDSEALQRAAFVLALADPLRQGRFELSEYHHLNLSRDLLTPGALEALGRINLLQAGIRHADLVTASSPRFARDLRDGDVGIGLEDVLRDREDRLVGILDGVNTERWDPSTDRYLKANYVPGEMVGKRSCKLDLQSELGNLRKVEELVVGIAAPLVEEAGAHLIIDAIPRLLGDGTQFVIVAQGERRFEDALLELAEEHPEHVGVQIGSSPLLTRKVQAGCDLMIFAARCDSSGVDAIRAMRYGAVPIARASGVLDDIVVDGEGGNGFKFEADTAASLIECIRRAGRLYRQQPESWAARVERCLQRDDSWSAAADRYETAYREAHARRAENRSVATGAVATAGRRSRRS